MKIAVTGHKPQRLKGQEKKISQWIHDEVRKLSLKEPITAAYTGMAWGVDQLFAIQCLLLNIPIYCVFPYYRENFTYRETYALDKAFNYIFLQDKYSKDSYYKRDCWMVDNCDVLIAVWDGIPQGETYQTIEYAKQKNKPIIYADAALLADLSG